MKSSGFILRVSMVLFQRHKKVIPVDRDTYPALFESPLAVFFVQH